MYLENSYYIYKPKYTNRLIWYTICLIIKLIIYT
nr:MAG TPA: hypothetical protein [Caudoviricetes sp.]